MNQLLCRIYQIIVFIANDVLYRTVEENENPSYSTDCNLIPPNAIYIKLVMGSIVDYYKPVTGKTYCEMLESSRYHQWSSDGQNWVIPNYYDTHLGGSTKGYPTDGREYLSFWGGYGNRGGCCHYIYHDKEDWNKEFKLFYATGNILFAIIMPYQSK